MGRASQKKGRRAEIELSRLLNEHGYHTAPGRAVSFGREADVVGLDGVHIEVKRRECPDISAALRQAREDAEYFNDGIPAVFHRGNRQQWRVIMALDDWLKLYGGKHRQQEQNRRLCGHGKSDFPKAVEEC